MARWQVTVEKTGAGVQMRFERGGDALDIELPGAEALRASDAIRALCGKTSASKAATPKGRKSASRTTGAGA